MLVGREGRPQGLNANERVLVVPFLYREFWDMKSENGEI